MWKRRRDERKIAAFNIAITAIRRDLIRWPPLLKSRRILNKVATRNVTRAPYFSYKQLATKRHAVGARWKREKSVEVRLLPFKLKPLVSKPDEQQVAPLWRLENSAYVDTFKILLSFRARFSVSLFLSFFLCVQLFFIVPPPLHSRHQSKNFCRAKACKIGTLVIVRFCSWNEVEERL